MLTVGKKLEFRSGSFRDDDDGIALDRRQIEQRPALPIGSSMMIKLPPRPVNTPPTDVESRDPRAVVINSASVFLAGSIPVPGKTRRYHSDVITAGQSLACLVASSWA
jgi:hypothetical protein